MVFVGVLGWITLLSKSGYHMHIPESLSFGATISFSSGNQSSQFPCVLD